MSFWQKYNVTDPRPHYILVHYFTGDECYNGQIHKFEKKHKWSKKHFDSETVFLQKSSHLHIYPSPLPVLQIKVWLAIQGAVFKDPETGNVPWGVDQHLERDGCRGVDLHSCFIDRLWTPGPQGTAEVFWRVWGLCHKETTGIHYECMINEVSSQLEPLPNTHVRHTAQKAQACQHTS